MIKRKMTYKKKNRLVPWCNKCDTEIYGNGSGVLPYRCRCGIWKPLQEWLDSDIAWEIVKHEE